MAVAETSPKKVEKKAPIEEEVTLERCLCYLLVSLIPLLFLVNQQQLIISQRALVWSLVPLVWKFLSDINKLIILQQQWIMIVKCGENVESWRVNGSEY